MDPSSAVADRGALFDRFPERSESVHGGNLFDEGFTLQSLNAAHGRLYDLFGASREEPQRGDRFDDFRWRAMPDLHGDMFDQRFGAKRTDGEHGTWFDVFRPGTGVRYRAAGADVEGVVDRVEDTHAIVRGVDGRAHEVGLSQFLAYRSPGQESASPTIVPSDAEAPSAHSADAHGATRASAPAYGTPWQTTPQGQSSEERSVPDGYNAATRKSQRDIEHLETLADGLDVAKAQITVTEADMDIAKDHIGFNELVEQLKKEHPDWSEERCKRVAGAIGEKKYGEKGMAERSAAGRKAAKSLSERVASFSRFGGNAVLKDMTTAERAIQGEEAAAAQSGAPQEGSWCGRCEVAHKEATYCPTCGTKLTTKTQRLDDLAKAFGAPADPKPGGQTVTSARHPTGSEDSEEREARSDPPGPEVPERAHRGSDHDESDSPRTPYCPHCGATLRELDERTEQGQHKCVGSALDVLKSVLST